MIDGDRATAAATGNPPLAFSKMLLAAWRGQHDEARELIKATMASAAAEGKCKVADFAAYALRSARQRIRPPRRRAGSIKQVFEHDHVGFGPLVIPELVEAASRTGNVNCLPPHVTGWRCV